MGVADLAENKHCCEQPLQDVRAGQSVKPSEENLYPYILIHYPPVVQGSMLQLKSCGNGVLCVDAPMVTWTSFPPW